MRLRSKLIACISLDMEKRNQTQYILKGMYVRVRMCTQSMLAPIYSAYTIHIITIAEQKVKNLLHSCSKLIALMSKCLFVEEITSPLLET